MSWGKRIAALLFCVFALAAAGAWEVSAASYETRGYDVEMTVSEDGVLQITETMEVDFICASHGIYRYIPYRGNITYEYGGQTRTEPYYARLRNIETPGFEKSVSYENDSALIRIGSEDEWVSGPTTYRLSYEAEVYADRNPELDQLYWGLIPTDTPTKTEAASFRIQLPKEIDPERVAFIAGRYGTADGGAVDFTIDRNTVSGRLNRPLAAGEGVTLRIELPEGYFTGQADNDWMYAALWIFICLAPITAAALWLLFGRDEKIIQTVEFYPPEGVSSAEIGYILDGASDDRDVISMVLYFAEKGYLEIYEDEDKAFSLVKKKELPQTAKSYERTMLQGLFAEGDRVYLKELSGEFYETFTAVKELLSGEFTGKSGKKVYTRASRLSRGFALLLMLNPLLAMVILGAGYGYRSIFTALPAIPLAMALFAGFFMIISAYDKKDNLKRGSKIAMRAGGAVAAAVGMLGFLVYGALLSMMLPSLCAAAASVVCFVFAMFMNRRTAYSADLMGKILGFREFIKTAELPRLKALVEETPDYFYNILPYAYVFGLSDQWAKNFEGIALQRPDWYTSPYGGGVFSAYYFMSSFHACTRALQSNIAVPPVQQGGVGSGGFSGGGFSGGGMGGGGMGSW